MNKEDYVSMEVAKLLKEKGYDEDCNILVAEEYWSFNKGKLTCVDKDRDFYPFPTLYEAQKWLRNNQNIHIVIDNYACGYAWFLYKADNGTRISEYAEDGPNDGGCWDTYEEALNAGILEALKRI